MKDTWLRHMTSSIQSNKLRGQLVRGAMGVGGCKLLALPLSVATSILLARGLGPEGYGQYALVIALITTLSIPLAPALMQLTTREAARIHADRKDQIHSLLLWANRHTLLGSVFAIIIVGAIALLMADWRADDPWTLLLPGLFALPLLGLNAVRSGILAGLRHLVLSQLPELFVRPLTLLIIAAMLLVTDLLNPLTALTAFIAGAALAYMSGTLLLQRKLPDRRGAVSLKDIPQKREWMRSWMPFTLLVTASTLNGQVGIILLGWLSNDVQVAAMQVAERGAMMVNLSLALVNIVISPYIAREFSQQNNEVLQKVSRYSARIALLAALPIALFLFTFAESIISFFFGKVYVEMATGPLRFLVFAQIINVAFGSLGMFLSMTNFEKDTLTGNTIALLTNGILCLFFIPSYGALGASFSTAIGLIVWNLFLAIRVSRRLGIRPGVI